MKKYHIDDLKNIDKFEEYPKDVNSDPFEQAEKLPGNIDIVGLKFYEKPGNKFYGPFYAIGTDGKLYGIFHFIYGVCYMWELVKYFGNSQAHVQRFNKNVYKGRNKSTQNGENDINEPITQSEEKDA